MTNVVFRPSARAELLHAADYYESRTPGRGADFADAIERAIDEITAYPERYAFYEGRRTRIEYRRYLLPKYPYLIAYVIQGDDIVVVAVAHTSRAPGYWERR